MSFVFNPGDTLSSAASDIFNGDWERFPELLDLNPGFDPLKGIAIGTQITLPDTSQVFQFANKELTSVSTGLSQLSNVPILSGYAQKALDVVGEINGTLNKAESIYQSVSNQIRNYSQPVNLVQWLLNDV